MTAPNDSPKMESTPPANIPDDLHVVPVKEMVIFPGVMLPLFFTGEQAIAAINAAMRDNHLAALVAQKDANIENPGPDALYGFGTAVRIDQIVTLPEGGAKVLVEGLARIKILEFFRDGTYLKAKVEEMREFYEKSLAVDAVIHGALSLLKVAMALGRPLPEDVMRLIDKIENPARLADLITVYLGLKIEEQEDILETIDPLERLKKAFSYLSREVQVMQVRGKIQADVAKELGKTQKEYLLRQQMKAIQKELGEEDAHQAMVNELREKIEASGMPQTVEEIAVKELDRLEKMNPASAEYTVALTYINYLVTMPWTKKTEDNLDIDRAEQILNEDHFGLEKAKERILEYLSVRKMKAEEGMKGPILCFVGPPGTGKTSIGKSIARAMERKFVRISLGGMRDEAEIRGHRRTYVGALPGRIIQEVRRCGTNNPIFMLDEVDKLGMDFRGDPASALLEVLDPEQNFSFTDHYLDVPFDLSKVMFITTANMLDPVPPALKDRMEVIAFHGYTEEEKEKIAFQYLIPKEIAENGLKEQRVEFSVEAIYKIAREYTREAGLRNLEREIASICRKIARGIAQNKEIARKVTPELVEDLLGPRKFFMDVAEEADKVGVATGLAWTDAGGDIIFVEATKMKGERGLTLTGSLGDIMKESAQAAMSYMRSHAPEYNIAEDFSEKHDVHIHVPAGAIPKDGPSAGITMAVALASLMTDRPARRDVAMTGEITLSGRVLPIGGVKEKVLAARRAGVKTVILPKKNEVNLEDIPDYIRNEMRFIFVETIDQVIKEALR
ncbi:MAG: endopeptidase La [Nitrospirota bacterium]|nr:endopeptidase La [Nitrospirota bacterium]